MRMASNWFAIGKEIVIICSEGLTELISYRTVTLLQYSSQKTVYTI